VSHLDELVRTLLYEGYALYPYTPGATKNATPTPFGIVYPPAYAQGSPVTFDRCRLQCIAHGPLDAELSATVLFLEPVGERHEGAERRVEVGPTTLGGEPAEAEFAFEAVQGRVRLSTQAFDGGIVRVSLCVHNTTPAPEEMDRAEALRSSLLSTHLLARVDGARFLSPVAPPDELSPAVMACASVNTYPVLATPQDDVMLGAAIVLPDHPQIAPESRGDLFDGTEIEEALLLHLLALSDGERADIARQDPAVREMLERAVRTTPQDIVALHGRVTVTDPEPEREVRGEHEAVVDGVLYRRGDTVRLRPGHGHGAQDHLLEGHTATIERIYIDYDDAIHLCVTVDDDPGQELMRDIGRYLYFKPAEVEVVTAV
jgi:hypothetical protein